MFGNAESSMGNASYKTEGVLDGSCAAQRDSSRPHGPTGGYGPLGVQPVQRETHPKYKMPAGFQKPGTKEKNSITHHSYGDYIST